MTFTEAAAEVLRLAGKPLHYKEITELAIEKNLLSHVGKSPEVTMGARLAALLKKEDKTNPIVRVKPGVFALRDWNDKKSKRAAAEDAEAEAADDSLEVNALEVEAATREAHPAPDSDDDDGPEVVVSGEDALRADLAASGAELFDDEDDDDQPILAQPGAPAGGAGAADPLGADGSRRRRRRRRRGRGGAADGPLERGPAARLDGASPGGPIQPTAIISIDGDSNVNAMRDPLSPAPRPQIRDRQQIMAGGAPNGIEVPLGDGEELAGKELADAAVVILNASDRSAGPVTIRAVVEALMRRGRLPSDPAAATTQLAAALRADNLRRASLSQRTRFRFANGSRVALTDWSLGPDIARLEQEVIAAVDRYREASRRVMLRKLQELPGHAFIELALLGLERVGMTGLKAVRRAGAPGGEAHFMATHKTGTDEIRTAIVIRKDGREIGRERVSDLRGALHHYGPATVGWLVTTGQILSGAREESLAALAPPIALYDGLAFCRLLEESDVSVTKTRFSIAIPDLELLETLRG